MARLAKTHITELTLGKQYVNVETEISCLKNEIEILKQVIEMLIIAGKLDNIFNVKEAINTIKLTEKLAADDKS